MMPRGNLTSWIVVWFRDSLHQAVALFMATFVLFAAGPLALGMTVFELRSPAAVLPLFVVHVVAVWTGLRPAPSSAECW